MGWSHIGGPADEVFDAPAPYDPTSVLYKTEPNANNPNITGDVSIFTPGAGWQRIGGPGSMFAVSINSLWGLTPNKDAIYTRPVLRDAYGPQGWQQVGGPANTIIAGSGDIALLTAQGSGLLLMYSASPSSWPQIGYPGYMFAVSRSVSYASPLPYIYGVTQNQMDIWRLLADQPAVFLVGRPWERITLDNQLGRVDGSGRVISRIRSIIAGETGLYADVEVTSERFRISGNVYQYGETPGDWTQIGSRLGELAIALAPHGAIQVEMLYSFTRNDGRLRRYTGTASNWEIIDQPNDFGSRRIHRIFSGHGRILVTLSDDDLWQYTQN